MKQTRLVRGTVVGVVILLGGALAAWAQAPFLVDDLEQSPGTPRAWSDPVFLGLSPAGRVLFTAEGHATGKDLWSTDGTPEGTYQLADVCPGTCDAATYPQVLAGGLSFFIAETGDLGAQLWRSDGTTAGTFPLTHIGSGGVFSFRQESDSAWIDDLGLLFFDAADGDHGAELWATDGTVAGTRMVADINPGREPSFPEFFAPFRSLVVFAASDGQHGVEPWVSDGTPEGTRMLREVKPGVGSSISSPFTEANGRLLFAADDGRHGVELWATDGTTRGTRLVRDLPHGPTGLFLLSRLYSLGRRAVFVANDGRSGDELWASDGTPAGTAPLTAYRSQHGFLSYSGELDLGRVGARVVFAADDGVHGRELWVSDGTRRGTRLIADLCPGACDGASDVRLAAGGAVLFSGIDPDHGIEPWVTNGTAGGTHLVADICPGGCGSSPRALAAMGGAFLISADEGTHGTELWRADGGGAVRLTDLAPEYPFPPFFTSAELGGKLLFPANDDVHGMEPWVTDGTPGGTGLLADLAGGGTEGSTPFDLLAAHGQLFLSAYDKESGSALRRVDPADPTHVDLVAAVVPPEERSPAYPLVGNLALTPSGRIVFSQATFAGENLLWGSDGTEEGTEPVSAGESIGWPELEALGDNLYLLTPFDGFWATDGTPEGTRRLDFVTPSPGLGFARLNDFLVFFGRPSRDSNDSELWKTDGTPQGTAQVADVRPGPDGSGSYELATTGDHAFFVADDGVAGDELWTSDGTDDGTHLVADLNPDGPSSLFNLTATSRLLFFVSASSDGFWELWRSDGTDAGTFRLTRIGAWPEFRRVASFQLTAMGDALFFVVADEAHGHELWKTDGTRRGTHLVADLWPGPASSFPTDLRAAAGRLYFAATDGRHGLEPWVSDGTAQGTFMLGDVEPGAGSSDPTGFTAAGGFVFFSAEAWGLGRELWAVDAAAPPPPPPP